MKSIAQNRNLLQAVSIIGAAAAITLPATVSAQVQDKPDGSWVSLSGQVASHTPKPLR